MYQNNTTQAVGPGDKASLKMYHGTKFVLKVSSVTPRFTALDLFESVKVTHARVQKPGGAVYHLFIAKQW